MRLIWASLETERFTFDAFSQTKAGAVALMRQAWQVHRRQTGAVYTWADLADSVNYTTIHNGRAYRDRELMEG